MSLRPDKEPTTLLVWLLDPTTDNSKSSKRWEKFLEYYLRYLGDGGRRGPRGQTCCEHIYYNLTSGWELRVIIRGLQKLGIKPGYGFFLNKFHCAPSPF